MRYGDDYSTTTITGGWTDDGTTICNTEFPTAQIVVTKTTVPFDRMTPEVKFEFWGEIFKELRKKIKRMVRDMMSLRFVLPAAPYRAVAYHRRICTPLTPTQHFKIHNSPIMFIREGL